MDYMDFVQAKDRCKTYAKVLRSDEEWQSGFERLEQTRDSLEVYIYIYIYIYILILRIRKIELCMDGNTILCLIINNFIFLIQGEEVDYRGSRHKGGEDQDLEITIYEYFVHKRNTR